MLRKGFVVLFLFAFAQGIQTDERLIRDQLTVVKLWFLSSPQTSARIGAAAGGWGCISAALQGKIHRQLHPGLLPFVHRERRSGRAAALSELGRIHVVACGPMEPA